MRRFRSLFLLGALGLLAGCSTTRTPSAEPAGKRSFLGLVTVEERNFVPADNNTFALAEGELTSNDERTGRKVSLLWGLITYTDY